MPATRARRNRAAAEQRPLRLPRGRPGPRGSVRARRRVTFLAGCVLLAASLPGAVGASAGQAQPTVYSGLGFDTCNAPPVSTLQAWLASPYRALGIYIGGANRACTSSQLSTAWVAAVVGMGWALAPLYVGLQAPCSSQSGVARITPSAAAAQGSAAAADAITQASALGLPAGSPLYFDMEAYALDDPSCTQTVQTFLSAWFSGLHARGYLAGVYGSAGSTIRDLQALATTAASPDEVWIGLGRRHERLRRPLRRGRPLGGPRADPPVQRGARRDLRGRHHRHRRRRPRRRGRRVERSYRRPDPAAGADPDHRADPGARAGRSVGGGLGRLE